MAGNKILLIDMYGVIIKESKGNFIPYTFEHFGSDKYDALTKAFRDDCIFTKAQLGHLTNQEFLEYLGYEIPGATMKDYLKNYLTLDEEFIPFAENCSKKMDFCLLSNDVLEWSEFLTDYYHMNQYFKEKIVSGEVHMRKPDKEIFLHTLERLKAKPGECIFVDNSVKNLLAAEKIGIHTILFNRDVEEYDGKVVNNFKELEEMLCNCF